MCVCVIRRAWLTFSSCCYCSCCYYGHIPVTGISKSIAKHTGKPETYVAVSVTDKASMIFGGTDDPCALGIMGSIGAIAMESNGAITSDVTDLLEEFGVKESRIYINFFDLPRANVGWSRRTFAG